MTNDTTNLAGVWKHIENQPTVKLILIQTFFIYIQRTKIEIKGDVNKFLAVETKDGKIKIINGNILLRTPAGDVCWE